jgi:hypothetical protein
MRSIFFADPASGSGAFLTPGSGIGKKMRIQIRNEQPGHISESLETIFGLKYLNFYLMRIRDPGCRKFGSGINIPDPQHCIFIQLNKNIKICEELLQARMMKGVLSCFYSTCN